MADDVNDPEQPGTSSAVSVSRTSSNETPKKGILKRPSLRAAQGEARDTIFPLPQHRPSPDRFPDKPGSRIPKLQVTWWEKNAVAIFGDTSDENNTDSEQILKDLGSGSRRKFFTVPAERHTAILDSEEDSEDVRAAALQQELAQTAEELTPPLEDAAEPQDDMMSVASSTGSASSMVVGRWWTGKDTRFVPHCVKRGCNHANHGELGEYLTPTQRRTKEMSELKKELRDAILERDDKDKHLQELRERIKEIELVANVQSALSEGSQLLQRERENREQHEKEKKQLERKHAIRVNQLVQETMNAREEISKLTGRIKELESLLHRPRTEMATNTDPVQYAAPSTSKAVPPTLLESRESQVRSPPTSPPNPLSPSPDAVNPLFSLPSPGSPATLDSKGGYQQPIYMSQEALNHMQACQNEAYIWRTKAAQLEIVVKDQLMKASNKEQTYEMQIQMLRNELEQRNGGTTGVPPKVSVEMSAAMLDSGIENVSHISPVHRPDFSDCSSPSCAERKKNLIEENSRLLETIEEANIRIRELEEDLAIIRKECDQFEEERDKMRIQLQNSVDDFESKVAELAASNIAVGRMQGDKVTMQKAISYMEERMQVYQNTLMEHDLIVSDETAGNWRKGFNDPRYSVMVSKRVQTVLTSDELSQHESEFKSTKQMLEDLHSEFSAKRTDLHGRFEEIERILLTKTQLVEALGKQLEDTRRDQRDEIDRHQQEREQYKRSLNDLALIAEKVPHLETRIDQLQKEIGEFDIRQKKQQEEYEMGLEEALEESLKKYKEQAGYWKDKVTNYEVQLEKSKNETTQLIREKEELKLKAKLDRVDLEQRLTSSIDHLSSLNSQMNKSRRDVECEARPRHVSKYVACRPNVKSKSTVIEKGDLFDEAEERLKLCQGELATTRRQVHVLQQKLISTMQERADRRVQVKRRIACVVDRPTSADGRKEKEADQQDEKMEALQNKNAQLREQLNQSEEEKASIVRKERERIQHLATEFDNVRKELDQEMCRYESEKKWLKSRIQNLEKDNKELQKMLEKSSSSSPDSKDSGDGEQAATVGRVPRIAIQEGDDAQSGGSTRKTLSEPELGFDDDETAKLRAENCRLHSELERVRETIRRTASNVSAASAATQRSQLSPAFANLADDLNMVKHDLEKILTTIDDEAPLREVERALSRSRTPVGSTVLSVGTVSRSPSTRRTPLEEQSEILEQVLLDWENEEKSQMARDLHRSREERDAMKLRIDRLQRELNTAQAELQLYRHEPMTTSTTENNAAAASGDGRLQKSRSVVNLISEADREDATRWKLKCGTMFRELNAMRSGYSKAMDERRELRIQLAMLKGELELAKCQVGDGNGNAIQSMSNSSYFSPRSMRSDTTFKSYESAEKDRNSREPVVVHESPAMFRKGSTRESLACSIQAPSREPSMEGARTEKSSRRDSNERKKEATLGGERRRSSSGQRRKTAANKDEYEAMEERRRSRKSISHYATAPQSMSSSMASLHKNHQQAATNVTWAKPPIPSQMSQSWHEHTASHMALTASFLATEAACGDGIPSTSSQPAVHGIGSTVSADELNSQIDAGGEDCRRSNQRVVSLREKVGRLNRENKKLADEVESWRNKAQTVEVQSSYRSGIDSDRLNRLEQEKETLKEQVELLLNKMQEAPDVPAPVPSPPPPVPTPTRDDMYLREQLTLSRQENEMYERKIRDLEDERREMYLVMFKKGQQAATMDMKEQKMADQMSEDRVVLKFLHDAFYYFLLNKGDSKEHLQVIMTMLDFSADQKEEILKKKGRPL